MLALLAHLFASDSYDYFRDELYVIKACASVEPAGTIDNPWAMPDERGLTLWLCRGRKVPLDQDWPSFKHYG